MYNLLPPHTIPLMHTHYSPAPLSGVHCLLPLSSWHLMCLLRTKTALARQILVWFRLRLGMVIRHGFDAVTIQYCNSSHQKQNKTTKLFFPRIYTQQVVSMLVCICSKWFSKQQISYYMAIRATSSLLAR